MKISFLPEAWEDYQYWAETDKKMWGRLNRLIKDTKRNPFSGIGKPESLKHDLAGYWSRRIDEEHRLVYKIIDDEMIIAQCRNHY